MNVPLLDLEAQHRTIGDDVAAAVDGVFDSQRFILGPEVKALEAEVAAYSGVEYGIGVSSGTDALLAALMAFDVGHGDEVITTAYSFFATAGVIARLGAKPVFVDIDPVTYGLDVDRAIELIGPRTKAILPVHLYGRMMDLDRLVNAADASGVPVIEDAAQAIGAEDSSGRRGGSVGQAGCFSFFPSKNLGGAGDGGMIVTDDAQLAERMRVLRVHGAKPKYHHHLVGGNFRLDALQAAVLRVKLPHLSEWSKLRRENADTYRNLISQAGLDDQVDVPQDHEGHIYNQFVLRVPGHRDGLQKHLTDAGVGNAIYYPIPLPLQECFAYLGHEPEEFPHAVAASRETLAIPIYPELTVEQQEYVVNQMVSFFSEA